MQTPLSPCSNRSQGLRDDRRFFKVKVKLFRLKVEKNSFESREKMMLTRTHERTRAQEQTFRRQIESREKFLGEKIVDDAVGD